MAEQDIAVKELVASRGGILKNSHDSELLAREMRGDEAQRNDGRSRATMIDVARDAGVSFKTVSRVLNGESNVREKTRQLVLDAAEKLNYTVNGAARSLRVGGPQIIAMLVSNPSRSYIESAHLGALQRCHETGMHLIMEEYDADISSLETMINSTMPLGIVVTPPLCDDPEVIALLKRKNISYVLIAPDDPETHTSINIDDVSAARDMTQHLIDLGHRRIGFIIGHEDHSVSEKRYRGYAQAMQAAKLPIEPDYVQQGRFSWDSGLKAAEKLLDLDERPTAIFASNDDMAAAVIAAAYRRHIPIPESLSVAGFDDTQVAAVISPQLTTVKQPIASLVSAAVGLLTNQMLRSDEKIEPVFLDYDLVIRESAGPAE